MADIFTRSRPTLLAANDFAAAVSKRFAYPAFCRPANDVGQSSSRRRRALLTSREVNERLLALLCTCAAAATGALWLVTYLRG